MSKLFKFKVLDKSSWVPSDARNQAFLIKNDWDDWFRYETLFKLTLVDDEGRQKEVGDVKIGQFNMEENQRTPNLPGEFDELGAEFFSLGQEDTYYEELAKLEKNVRSAIIKSLNDLVANEELWGRAKSESVTQVSLLRGVTESTVEGQFRRLLQGGARLTKFRFNYSPPPYDEKSPPRPVLKFFVTPDSRPPTNIHVLIGRNGVGKTSLLNAMARCVIGEENSGKFVDAIEGREATFPLANLVSISFSAFDPFKPPPEFHNNPNSTPLIKCSYVGLKRTPPNNENLQGPKTLDELAEEFVESFKICNKGRKARRWKKAISTLETDPIFEEANVTEISTADDARKTYKRLSSGHKIVLLTITRLVEKVEEKTLVLIDEPESHLHPPLLSAFIRSLSDLLIDRNGVAIIATHSPVVLQEVPSKCVWKIRRSGREMNIARPEMETFGENVGVLTREVFALEVTQSGFHNMLREVATKETNFEAALMHFNDSLGDEAKAILRALFLEKSSKPQRE